LRGSRRVRKLAAALHAAAVLSAGAGASIAQPVAGGGAELVLSAIGLVGTAYRQGGDRPDTGLDCSGLVRHVARGALGVELPRQAEAISRVGVEVDPRQLQAGDLVFFNTLGRPFSHIGLYVGDGQFVHAPARRGRVRVESMSLPYWRLRFDGARRLPALADESTALALGNGEAAASLPSAPLQASVEP
jgi:cell wall-associated NlpC family hydrolase